MKIASMKPWKYVSRKGEASVIEGGRTRPLHLMECARGWAKDEVDDLAYSVLMDYFLHFRKSIIEANRLAAPLYGEFRRHVLDHAPQDFEISDERIDLFLAYQPETRIAMAEAV